MEDCEEVKTLLEMYRKGYEGILDDLKENIDKVMDLLADGTTCGLTIEITIEPADIPRYTIKSQKLPSTFLSNKPTE